MAKIIKVHSLQGNKFFYCDAGDIPLQVNDYVILDTGHDLDIAKITAAEVQALPGDLSEPLMTVVRQAQTEDLIKARQKQEGEALTKCKEMVVNLSLRMKPLTAHYDLESGHIAIFFSARERIDFRGLIRKLSRNLETRVELKQIGPRDEAKLLGGIGKCGYPLCCQSFLTSFTPVSIKMAKEQGLALNPMKISGICGKLLCCLAHESKESR